MSYFLLFVFIEESSARLRTSVGFCFVVVEVFLVRLRHSGKFCKEATFQVRSSVFFFLSPCWMCRCRIEALDSSVGKAWVFSASGQRKRTRDSKSRIMTLHPGDMVEYYLLTVPAISWPDWDLLLSVTEATIHLVIVPWAENKSPHSFALRVVRPWNFNSLGLECMLWTHCMFWTHYVVKA